MNELTVFEQDGQLLTDSREVAQMVEKEHNTLLRDIRGYIKHLLNGELRSMDFFIESTYIDSIGRELPCYLCTKKGCDMIANKLTGKKGVLFTAKYVSAFEKMKDSIQQGKLLATSVPFTEVVQSLDAVARSLNVNEASKILMFQKLYEEYGLPTGFLPKYEFNGNRQLKSATELLKEGGYSLTAHQFLVKLIEKGLMERRSRKSAKKGVKYFNVLVGAGLEYGENGINPHNQRETQPSFYADKFEELYNIMSEQKNDLAPSGAGGKYI